VNAGDVAEYVVFAVAALSAIVGALGVVLGRNTVHAALALVATLFAVAVLFVMQEAHFLAAVQIIVYAGAIVVLFLFVIMLLGVDRHEELDEALPLQRWIAAVVGLGALVLVGILLGRGNDTPVQRSGRGPLGSPGENPRNIGRSLFSDYLWAFEITSVLLVIAVVGAVVLVRRRPAAPSGGTTGASAPAERPGVEEPRPGGRDEPAPSGRDERAPGGRDERAPSGPVSGPR
jgi:NADH-quinone oxidoreductase subunit J